jgi:hypothetical protein
MVVKREMFESRFYEWGPSRTRGVANRVAPTGCTRANKREEKKLSAKDCKRKEPQPLKIEKQLSPKINVQKTEAWRTKTPEAVKIPKCVKQERVGKVKPPKLKPNPALVCTEKVQLSYEEVSEARDMSNVITDPSCTSDMTSRSADPSQLIADQSGQLNAVMRSSRWRVIMPCRGMILKPSNRRTNTVQP